MPRIYDKQGNELTVGARAEYGHLGPVTIIEIRPDRVYFQRDGLDIAEGCSIDPFRHRSPDLLLIDSPTEGKEG
jgi:hypothetical protein